MTDQYANDATEYADDATQAATEEQIFTQDDILDGLDEDETALTLTSLAPSGEYVVYVPSLSIIPFPGSRDPKGWQLDNVRMVYNIAAGKHMSMSCRGREWERGKTGAHMDDWRARRGKVLSSVLVAFTYSDGSLSIDRKGADKLKAEALPKINAKEPGYKPSEIVRGAQGFYAIAWVKQSPASGNFDASMEVNIGSLRPITPALFDIMAEKLANGGD